MVREIMHDEGFLSQKAELCTPEDKYLYDDLLDTLDAHKDGCVGMAANMLGINKCAIVFDNDGTPCVMFNPVIIDRSGPYETEEGCLSLKGKRKCSRFQKITVSYLNKNFRGRTESFEGFVAEIIQHEVDHTNGILI